MGHHKHGQNMDLAPGGIGVGQAVPLCWGQACRGDPRLSGHLGHNQAGHLLPPFIMGRQQQPPLSCSMVLLHGTVWATSTSSVWELERGGTGKGVEGAAGEGDIAKKQKNTEQRLR